MVIRKIHRASNEYKVRISVKCTVLVQVSILMKSSSVCLIYGVESKMNDSTVILTKRVANVQRGMSNTNVEFKKRKDECKTVFQ